MKVFAVLLAAGRSERFGADKLWADWHGQPLWFQSYRTLLDSPVVDAVGIVGAEDTLDRFLAIAPEAHYVLAGGATRQQSSRIGVEGVPDEFEIVLVHDAARPFVTHELIERVAKEAERTGASFPGIPLVDTVKVKDGDTWSTPDRTRCVAVQTPQGARRGLLLSAFGRADREFTDESSLIESLGLPVGFVSGDIDNMKVTHPQDIQVNMTTTETRTGLGYDIHAFSSDINRPMWLGGVEFDDRPGLDGHSDADALIHAVVDALLGAASLGDIGVRFPNTDGQWKDAPSSVFLQDTVARLRSEGWTIQHVDATVIAERPKVMARRTEVCSRLSELMGIQTDRVNVKATTNEGLGSLGRGEGLSAFAVATITRFSSNEKPSSAV